ncbi:rho GTPase-activating protein 18-like isoform X1 [Sycon ciliatum]|uniref:rho GTPase-activating protein 18-like isoform X1 n=1 Tax=Sycon ciliatum TaxID=27933 RepID=UPI0031F625E5
MALKGDQAKKDTPVSTSFTEHFVRSHTISSTSPLVAANSRPSYLRTNNLEADQSKLKSLDLDVYWKEFEVVRESTAEASASEETDEAHNEPPPGGVDSCDEEKAWLMQAGLGEVASQLQDNQIVDIDNVKKETSKLNFTNQQTAAVVRRVTRANTAIQKWKAKTTGLQDSGNSRSNSRLTPGEPGSPEGGGAELVLTPSGDNLMDEDGDFLIYGYETESARDFVTLRADPAGISMIEDFSADDCTNLRRIALIELTAVLDKFNISVRPLRHRKVKKNVSSNEHAILGVPLTTLLERDQLVDPSARIPFFVTQICEFMEENGLEKEGIFRVPGNSAKLKRLREEMESGPIRSFSWEGRGVNDAATFLKQFLRELPIPLLTFEYLSLFTVAENLKSRKLQLKAFNLLLILIPDVHREVLKRLLELFNKVIDHEERNKMGVNNVAMIVAPNLFCKLEQMTGNAEAEVRFAAGSSHAVRFLITFAPILFAVPSYMVRQLRQLTDVEGIKGRKPKSTKEVQRLLKKEAKREKSYSGNSLTEYRSSFDGIDGPSNESATSCVIKVLSPEYLKVSMAMEIHDGMTASGVLDLFKKRQTGAGSDTECDNNSGSEEPLDRLQQHLFPTSPLGSRQHSPRSSVSLQCDPRQYRSRTGSVSLAETVTGLCDQLADADLYESGGNVHERKLRADFDIMAIRRINPSAQWVIRKRQRSPVNT